MKLGDAVPIEVVKRRKDGSGIVRLPVMTVADSLDLSRTAGGGDQTVEINSTMLAEMVANHGGFPGPVGVTDGDHADDRSGPQAGFVDGLEVRGSQLWATIDLGPRLFGEVVNDHAWRGFSIEMERDLVKPTKSFQGWVLTGGVFTNSPALDVHFRVAASVADGDSAVKFLALRGEESEDMSDANVAKPENILALKAENDALRGRLTDNDGDSASLQIKLGSAQGESNRLKGEVEQSRITLAQMKGETVALQTKVETLITERDELSRKLTEQTDAQLAADVVSLCEQAIGNGLPPAMFDGHDKDPVTWFKSKFTSLDTLKTLAESAGPIKLKSATSSGTPDDTADDSEKTGLDKDAEARLARMGLSTSYDGVSTAEDLAQLKIKE